ncbi:MAG TPA: cbb3-type cytochrome c oxidase subunit I [Vicinamibacterales bacterium]|nr:cbb3-type cytochrome c oxidase subunit I [Vicinamibacterales bacterium]
MFSTDHKTIGIQYGITALMFLFLGFCLMMVMRWSIAYPDQPVPVVGKLLLSVFGPEAMPNGAMGPDLYNSFGAMHGTIMVFLAIVPLAFAAFGNYVVPLQIGAPDMAFPRVNMASFHSFFIGGVIMFSSFFIPGGAAKSGWTSYSPLATFAERGYDFNGQTFWIIGMVFLITSSLLGAVNFIATIIQLRAPGMTWMRMPFFCWAQFVTAFLLLLAFPPLEAAAVMQLMDNLAGTSFFLPSGLMLGGTTSVPISGGGSPLLWQHLFWFLGHPEVYVLILPGMGIVAEIITNNARKPIWGYKSLVYSVFAIGFLSFIVWAHHMYLTGMGTKISTFFQTTTMIISIPSVIILTCLFITLWGGSIRFNTPMLFALAFLPMFGIGGLTGLPLGLAASDVTLHDTYYIVAHFHYLVAPGTVFALFAGIYHWFPAITGRSLDERLGKIHFWGSFVCMNLIFMPMFAIGLMGVNRRLWDAGASYAHAQPTLKWQTHITYAAFLLAAFQLPFIWNLLSRGLVLKFSKTLSADQVRGSIRPIAPEKGAKNQHLVPASQLGMWLFIASEAMFFGALFSGYVMLRVGSSDWPGPVGEFPWLETLLLIGASAAFGAKRSQLIVSNALGVTFVVIKVIGDVALIGKGITPSTDLMWACWFTLTWVHAFHVLAGAVFTGWLAGPSFKMAAEERERWMARIDATRRYWLFVDLVWLFIVGAFYF